jgi:polysaccharide export outer membrane protein
MARYHHAGVVFFRCCMNRRRALLVLASALPLAGCLQPGTTGSITPARPVGADGYVLATGDKLRIIVFGQDTLSNIYQVDGSGRITMPLIGPVAVGGMSTAAAGSAIESKLKGGYIREPKVTVEVDTYRPFFILARSPPRPVPVRERDDGADRGRDRRRIHAARPAQLRRGDPSHDAGIQTAEVPVTYAVRPGDTIVIKERWF